MKCCLLRKEFDYVSYERNTNYFRQRVEPSHVRHRIAGRHQALSDASRQVFTAIRDVNLAVAPGEFVAVVGPTGCGKSTTLGLISGLERPSDGMVEVMGKPVQGIDRASAMSSRPTRSSPGRMC